VTLALVRPDAHVASPRLEKAHFDRTEPRDPRGRWTLLGAALHALGALDPAGTERHHGKTLDARDVGSWRVSAHPDGVLMSRREGPGHRGVRRMHPDEARDLAAHMDQVATDATTDTVDASIPHGHPQGTDLPVKLSHDEARGLERALEDMAGQVDDAQPQPDVPLHVHTPASAPAVPVSAAELDRLMAEWYPRSRRGAGLPPDQLGPFEQAKRQAGTANAAQLAEHFAQAAQDMAPTHPGAARVYHDMAEQLRYHHHQPPPQVARLVVGVESHGWLARTRRGVGANGHRYVTVEMANPVTRDQYAVSIWTDPATGRHSADRPRALAGPAVPDVASLLSRVVATGRDARTPRPTATAAPAERPGWARRFLASLGIGRKNKTMQPDLVKVGPKGYIHNWILVGVPVKGVEVHHPEHGRGTVIRAGKRTAAVRFDSGHEASFEHGAAAPKPTPVPPLTAPAQQGGHPFSAAQHEEIARAAESQARLLRDKRPDRGKVPGPRAQAHRDKLLTLHEQATAHRAAAAELRQQEAQRPAPIPTHFVQRSSMFAAPSTLAAPARKPRAPRKTSAQLDQEARQAQIDARSRRMKGTPEERRYDAREAARRWSGNPYLRLSPTERLTDEDWAGISDQDKENIRDATQRLYDRGVKQGEEEVAQRAKALLDRFGGPSAEREAVRQQGIADAQRAVARMRADPTTPLGARAAKKPRAPRKATTPGAPEQVRDVGPKDFDPYRAELHDCQDTLCRAVAHAASRRQLTGESTESVREHQAAARALLAGLQAGTHQHMSIAERAAEARKEKEERLTRMRAEGASAEAIAAVERGYTAVNMRDFYATGMGLGVGPRHLGTTPVEPAKPAIGTGAKPDELIQVYDVGTGPRDVPRAEAAAGHARYARSLGRGSPAAGVGERRAMALARGEDVPTPAAAEVPLRSRGKRGDLAIRETESGSFVQGRGYEQSKQFELVRVTNVTRDGEVTGYHSLAHGDPQPGQQPTKVRAWRGYRQTFHVIPAKSIDADAAIATIRGNRWHTDRPVASDNSGKPYDSLDEIKAALAPHVLAPAPSGPVRAKPAGKDWAKIPPLVPKPRKTAAPAELRYTEPVGLEPGAKVTWSHDHGASTSTRTGTVWSGGPNGSVWVIPDEHLPTDQYHAINVHNYGRRGGIDLHSSDHDRLTAAAAEAAAVYRHGPAPTRFSQHDVASTIEQLGGPLRTSAGTTSSDDATLQRILTGFGPYTSAENRLYPEEAAQQLRLSAAMYRRNVAEMEATDLGRYDSRMERWRHMADVYEGLAGWFETEWQSRVDAARARGSANKSLDDQAMILRAAEYICAARAELTKAAARGHHVPGTPYTYYHGWILRGLPDVGSVVHHPEHGEGVITGRSAKRSRVAFASGARHSFEHGGTGAEHFNPRPTATLKPSGGRVDQMMREERVSRHAQRLAGFQGQFRNMDAHEYLRGVKGEDLNDLARHYGAVPPRMTAADKRRMIVDRVTSTAPTPSTQTVRVRGVHSADEYTITRADRGRGYHVHGPGAKGEDARYPSRSEAEFHVDTLTGQPAGTYAASRAAATARKPKAPSTWTPATTVSALERASTEAQGRDILAQIPRNKQSHKSVAEALGVETRRADSMSAMRDAILRHAVTRRLEHDAYLRRAKPASLLTGERGALSDPLSPENVSARRKRFQSLAGERYRHWTTTNAQGAESVARHRYEHGENPWDIADSLRQTARSLDARATSGGSSRLTDYDMTGVLAHDQSGRNAGAKFDARSLRSLADALENDAGPRPSTVEIDRLRGEHRRMRIARLQASLATNPNDPFRRDVLADLLEEEAAAGPIKAPRKASTPRTPKAVTRRNLVDGEVVVWEPPQAGDAPVRGRAVRAGRNVYIDWEGGRRERVTGDRAMGGVRRATPEEAATPLGGQFQGATPRAESGGTAKMRATSLGDEHIGAGLTANVLGLSKTDPKTIAAVERSRDGRGPFMRVTLDDGSTVNLSPNIAVTIHRPGVASAPRKPASPAAASRLAPEGVDVARAWRFRMGPDVAAQHDRTHGDQPLYLPNRGDDQGLVHLDSQLGELWTDLVSDKREPNSVVNEVAHIGERVGMGQVSLDEAARQLRDMATRATDQGVARRMRAAADAITEPGPPPVIDVPANTPAPVRAWLEHLAQIPTMRKADLPGNRRDQSILDEAIGLVREISAQTPDHRTMSGRDAESRLEVLTDTIHESIDGVYHARRLTRRTFGDPTPEMRAWFRGR
jgi:hypothetical protein